MDKLKALLQAKQKEVDTEFGEKRALKQSEIEEHRLKRLREEEDAERAEKERKYKKQQLEGHTLLRKHSSLHSQHSEELLAKDEVIRRLRLLGQPATLFGEEDIERQARLRKAQEELQLEDEHAGGQQANTLLGLQRQNMAGKGRTKGKEEEKKEKKDKQDRIDKEAEPGNEAAAEEPEDETLAAFKRAAQALKEKREEEKLPIEQKIKVALKKWCKEWEEDLDARPEEVKNTAGGNQATVNFKQTMGFLGPLFKQLDRDQLIPEMKAGLWMVVQDMKERNYIHAYDIYMRLSIGNAPWPIGVTSVGIHERSAREKISHVMNGAAHIMNDESTRKFLQAIKRLLTIVQRLYPTDPSRCVDFDGFRDQGRGAIGGGSDKRALLEAERRGENASALRLAAPPHFLDKDGSVKVPPKWNNIMAHSEVYKKEMARS